MYIQGSQIKSGAIISYIATFVNIILTFFYIPWMIRQIGVSDYGLYGLMLAIMSYFVLDFGLSSAIARFIAKYRVEGNEKKVSDMLGLTTKVYLSLDIIIFIVLVAVYFFLDKIYVGLTLEELGRLKVIYCISGAFSVFTFVFKPMHGALIAFEYFVDVKAIDLFQKVGTIALIIVVLLLGGGLYELVLINGVIGLFCSILMYFIFKHKSHVDINLQYFDKKEMMNLFIFSIWVFIITLSNTLKSNLCPTLLGIFSDTRQISLFSVSISIQGIIYTISAALNGLFLPKVTRMIHNRKKNDIDSLMVRVGRIQLYIVGLIIFGFAIFGKPFVKLWMGEDFEDIYFIILIIIIPLIVYYTQHIAEDVVYAENEIKYSAIISISCAVFSFIFACVFSPYMGAIGCALAMSLSTVINIIFLNVFYKRKMKLDIYRFFRECHLRVMPILAIMSVIFFIIMQYIVINSWSSLVCYMGFYVFCFVLVSYFFIFNEDEKKMLNIFITNR